MTDDKTAPQADESTVDATKETDAKVEPTTVEDDALNALTDVKGEVTTNIDPLGDEQNDDTKDAAETPEEKKPATEEAAPVENEEEVSEEVVDEKIEPDSAEPPEEAIPEKDETGVYSEPTAPDPGEFKPGDYSFEIKTTDGKTHKISAPEDADAFATTLDEDPSLITASQFSLFNRKMALMEQGLASDKKEFEAQKERWTAEQTQTKTRNDTLDQWYKEVEYLRNRGELPKITAEQNTADWTNPEIAKQPGVKETLAIFQWMEEENNRRMEAGLEPMKSALDAHNAMQLESMRKGADETKSKDTEIRQKRGGMVGKGSPYSPENQPEGSIVGEGGSLNDLVTEFINT